MTAIHEILQALWQQDFTALAEPGVIGMVYAVIFVILVLENGLLPASFLPGDSLLLLTGALIAQGVMSFLPTLLLLTTAASLGCWLSYLQGRWLSHTRFMRRWLLQLPRRYHRRTRILFQRHGLTALIIGRFLAFVRTLVPTMAGVAKLNNTRFQIFNWLSAVIWVGGIVSLGYAFSLIPFIQQHEEKVMSILMLIPIALIILGVVGAVVMFFVARIRSRRRRIA